MTATSPVEVRPVSGALGAELTGVLLGPDMSDAQVARVREAVLVHKVVVVRDQHHLDDGAHTGFARRLGPLTTAFPTAHPTVSGAPERTVVLPVESGGGYRANKWHTDVTFVDRPPAFSVLRALVLPPFGGDTAFANTALAYRALPAGLRTLADGLWAEHASGPGAAAFRTRHPVVRVHPETGERSLLLGHFVRHIEGVDAADSAALLGMFERRVTRMENTMRWRWSTGDVAIWDNRATQHYAVADYGRLPRTLHRVTVAGEYPVSVDGRRSVAVAGDSDTYVGAHPRDRDPSGPAAVDGAPAIGTSPDS
ncbi:taurine catabolism dioxygenase [Pseudonocardia sp. TMWB2A]|uniref:TauD/TfdA dioxygenase family protein n=1 Tax=Pseudonocardia sp. TMWB2A TaxID=687430 RepID=UPI00307F9A2A